ncbi:MAG: electron transport complex subunit RsxA [Candidatus Delongbacteria bacterium]|jgi:electron transport complex protein RnfA|nr:electron transport complex subunit RsxA [Candidatus Delongbacteria bacterium]MDY0016275.1 electron transport complex subunit RsxA [Candidatus Delongbacteria bacterium]
MDFSHLVVIAVSSIFINNFVLGRFLGICPFIGVSKKLESAVGMGMAVIFVMTLASIATYTVQKFILDPFGIQYLQTIAFILVIASLVQFIEMFMKKNMPSLYSALGIFLPLITTNCAVLGVAILNIDSSWADGTRYNFIESAWNGFTGGVGFTVALVLMAGIRERLELADLPESLKGLPIAFITSALIAMAFLGFSGMSIM